MKRFAFTGIGALAGSVLVWGVTFLVGYSLNAAGIRLYESEFDQQRNFNVFVLAWLIFAIVGGWLGWRIGKPKE